MVRDVYLHNPNKPVLERAFVPDLEDQFRGHALGEQELLLVVMLRPPGRLYATSCAGADSARVTTKFDNYVWILQK
jgi:hypothetical protein